MGRERDSRFDRKSTGEAFDIPIKPQPKLKRIFSLLDAIKNGQDPGTVQTNLDRQEERARSSVQNVRAALNSLPTCNGW